MGTRNEPRQLLLTYKPCPLWLAEMPEDVMQKVFSYLSEFEPSAKFTGPRHGYVFKMGRQGLGYYVDHSAHAVSSSIINLSATCSELRTAALASLSPRLAAIVLEAQARSDAASAECQRTMGLKQVTTGRGRHTGGRVSRFAQEIAGACSMANMASLRLKTITLFAGLCKKRRTESGFQ